MSDVVAVLDDLYPPAAAEAWDRVGLTVGSRAASVTKVLYAVDCTAAVVAEAVSVGADLIVAHHPLLLRGVHAVTDDHPLGSVVIDLITRGIALHVAHTNADKPAGGVVSALTDALGLLGAVPLVPTESEPLDLVVTFVPTEQASAVVDAVAAAGAGALGNYDQCSFRSTGYGTFRPLPGATPHVGTIGELALVPETRIEMVLPRSRRGQVVRALLQAHPYETPAYHLLETVTPQRSGSGLGRIGVLPAPISLAGLASRISQVLPRTGAGLRVAGDPDRRVEVVAVQAGAGEDLLNVARTSGADVYVTSDLRHHPASEALQWLDGPALIDLPHWAAESLWLPVVQRLLNERLSALRVELPSLISTVVTDPWTFAG